MLSDPASAAERRQAGRVAQHSTLITQLNPQCALRLPRVARVVGGGDFGGERRAACEERGDIEPEMPRGKGREVFCAERKKADGGTEAASVFGVRRVKVLLLQMDEGSGDLDEAFVEKGVGVAAAEPEVFEDIVGLIVLGGIEAGEVARVVRVEGGRGAGAEAADEGGDAVAFFHGTAVGGKTILRGVVCDKKRLVFEASDADAL